MFSRRKRRHSLEYTELYTLKSSTAGGERAVLGCTIAGTSMIPFGVVSDIVRYRWRGGCNRATARLGD